VEYYVGIDVSLKENFISIVDKEGIVVKEGAVKNCPHQVAKFLNKYKGHYKKIGLESGAFATYLCKELGKLGYAIICVDARKMAASLSARINKNDKNDARGIAQMMRVNLYKEVYIKSDVECEQKILLKARRQLVKQRKSLRNVQRGLLKTYGLTIEAGVNDKIFAIEVRRLTENLSKTVKLSFMATLSVLEVVTDSLAKLDKELGKLCKDDKDCKLLMTVPGVGVVTAMTFITTIGDASRFVESEQVGAYLGLTPKQYSSGEVNHQGRISKMGSSECRTMMYEAANSMLNRSQKKCAIKTWGVKLAKKKGKQKAKVAIARRMAVTMHRMLVDKTEFRLAA
jgi:transposase